MVCAIIVAAGQGVRMKASTRKQYLLLGREPVILRTIRIFDRCQAIDRIYLVVPPGDKEFCRQMLARSSGIQKECHVIGGGDTRQASVYRGLLALEAAGIHNGLVAVHDGVRPLVSTLEIESCVEAAQKNGACLLAVPAQDTLKKVRAGTSLVSETLSRKGIWLAQTPQVFQYSIIRKAHERALQEKIEATDDAMLVERTGVPVSIVSGSRKNIKITTQEDLALAEAILSLER